MQTSWEAMRRWDTVRYLVYYLVEDLVPKSFLPGKDVVDFSCGLGDLSQYLLSQNPKSLTATSPDSAPPPYLSNSSQHTFVPNVQASQILATLGTESCDLFVARMVFQFPTSEEHFIDVDGMLSQIQKVLRPGGRLVICSHAYTELGEDSSLWGKSPEEIFAKSPSLYGPAHSDRIRGLIELIQTIGLPPREGVHGQTGFGLKAVMCIDSFVKAGFHIEECAEIEDFTFPMGLKSALSNTKKMSEFEQLSKKVFQIKKDVILSDSYRNKYQRPALRQSILRDINKLHPFVTVPIFSVTGRKTLSD